MTNALKACVGREVTYVAPEPLGAASIRYFATATGDTNPLYSDEVAASLSRHGGIIAPPTMVCETGQFYVAPQGPDGYLGHRWELPIESDRHIRGGNEYELFQPVRPDDRITVTWRIVDIYERETRKGGAMIFIVSEARYSNQRGELLAINRETTIR
jgi:acyl dehydratase